MERNFKQLLEAKWAEGKFVCVGLDPDWNKLPGTLDDRWSPRFKGATEGLLAFNTAIIDATADIAACYKPNLSFFLKHGKDGVVQLIETIQYVLKLDQRVPVICRAMTERLL